MTTHERMSAKDLAALLGLTRESVKRLARQGRLDHVRVGTEPLPGRRDVRRVEFTPEQVELAIAAYTEVVPAKKNEHVA